MLTDFRRLEDARALVVQPDGKLVVAGGAALARYNPDGSLDRSFGDGGRVRRNLGSGNALVLQPDGKLVAAGSDFDDLLARFNADVFLARFNANGSPDTTFGAGGLVRTDFGGRDAAEALVLQPDGKLVGAVVRLGPRPGPGLDVDLNLILVRYHNDGSLDVGFGAGGFVVVSLRRAGLFARGFFGIALLLQPDGKLVAADGGQLFRLNPDGTLDMSFGDGGVSLGFGGPIAASALVLQADGKLVAAGGIGSTASVIGSGFLLARFNPDGSIDTSFGTGGLVMTDFGRPSRANALVLQADGKLVAGGLLDRSGLRGDFALARYNPDGSLDTSFGSGGTVRTRGRSFFGVQALALQADGKLVAAGDALLAQLSQLTPIIWVFSGHRPL